MTENLIFLQPIDAAQPIDGFYHPPYISMTHVFNSPKGWFVAPRRFRQYQFQYVLSGAAIYTIEGNQYETKKGDLILHYPNEDHEVRTIDNIPYVCVSIVFHFGQSKFPIEEMLSRVNYMGNFENTRMETIINTIPAEFQQPDLLHRLRAQYLLMEVIHTLLAENKPNTIESERKQQTQANLVLLKNYIAEHYHEEVTYETLKELTYWSKNYINQRFKETYGISPSQYQIQLRIEKAKALAIQSNMSVTEIAYQVGYSDVHTLGRIFKKKTGLSLTEYCSSLQQTFHNC